MTKADVTLFRNLFARIDDAYGVMGNKYPLAIREPLTVQLLKDHLDGKKRIGAYQVDKKGMANQIVIDFDIPKEKAKDSAEWERVRREAQAVLQILDDLGIEAFIASSKSRGYHVRSLWEPAPARDLRRVGRYILRKAGVDAEVFPKQDQRRSDGGLGNFVLLPLHGGSLKKGRTAILDRANGLDPFPDQWEALRNIRINSPDTLSSALAVAEEWEKVSGNGSARKTAAPVGNRIPDGKRNNTLISLGGTMRRRGMSETAILSALLEENRGKCIPPLPEDEVQRIARNAARYEPEAGAAFQFTERFRATDLWTAKLFTYLYAGKAKCCPRRGGWHVYDGKRWVRSECGEIERMAKEIPRAILELAFAKSDAEDRTLMYKFAAAMESAKKIDAMLSLAATEEGIAVPPEAFDADPWKFNCQTGTLVLDPTKRKVTLRPHRPEDLITNISPAEWRGPKTPLGSVFEKYLEESARGDQELIGFRRRLAGYAMFGDMREQVFEFAYGPEAGGKTTETNARFDVMGDYARAAEISTFLISRSERTRNDIAGLVGARLVVASEPEEGQVLDEGIIKRLTGQNPMKARFLYKEFFDFKCGFKLRFEGNHRPRIRSVGGATWRRLLIIPFEHTVPEDKRDKMLGEKLKSPEERAGILAWMVRGALEWLRNGLRPPDKVRVAVAEYRKIEDQVGRFVEERCVVGEGKVVPKTFLYGRYVCWCETGGEEKLSKIAFGMRLNDKGFKLDPGKRKWRGVGMRES